MANEARASLILQLKDLVSDGLNKIGSKLENLGDNLEKSKFLWAGIFGAIVTGIGLALKAFGEEERAIASLTQALLNQGVKASTVIEGMKEYAAQLQKVSTYQDDQILSAQSQLVSFGLIGEKLKETTKLTLDFAAAKGIDLTTAATLVGKAFAGETSMLSRYGVIVDDALPKTEKFDAVLRILGQRFGGQALAQQQTFLGQLESMKNAFNDLAEEVGSAFSPIMEKAIEYIRGMIEKFQGLSPQVKTAIVVIAGVVAAFTGLLTVAAGLVAIWPFLAAGFAVIAGPIGLVTLAVVGTVAAVYLLKDTFVEMGAIAMQVAENIALAWASVAEAFYLLMTGKFKEGWEKFKEATADGLNALVEGFKASRELAAGEMDELKAKIMDFVTFKKDAEDKEVVNTQAARTRAIQARLVAAAREREIEQLKQKDFYTLEELETKKRLDLEEKSYQKRVKGAEDYRQFMIGATSSQYAALKGIAKVFLIQETIANTQRAAMGAYAAMSSIPFVGPVLGAAAAAAAIAYGAERVASIAALAEGGLVMPRAGGTIAQIGEAGSKEAVIPLDDSRATQEIREALGGDGVTININAGVIVADDESVQQFAKKIDAKLYELKRTRQSVSI